MRTAGPPRVFVLTDCTDVAAAEIRLSIIEHLSDGNLASAIEPIVPIAPLSVMNGAFVNRLIGEICPEGSILFTVLNPVQEQPHRVFGTTDRRNLTFIGRDTGVFSWIARDFGCNNLFHLPERPYVPFGGKHIYPRAVAHLLEGGAPAVIGSAVDSGTLRSLDIECGQVIHIDNFGICKLFARFSALYPGDGDEVQITIGGNEPIKGRYLPRLMAGQDRELLVFPGSSLGGLAEVAVTRGSAAAQLGIVLGQKISIQHRGVDVLLPPR